jgi:hypothetical protein
MFCGFLAFAFFDFLIPTFIELGELLRDASISNWLKLLIVTKPG